MDLLASLSLKPHDLVVIAAYLAAACAIFGGGALIQPWVQRLSERSGFAFDGDEGARKFAHVCCGGFVAALPYTGAGFATGIILGGGIITALLLLRTPAGTGPLDYLFNRRAGSVTFATGVVLMSLFSYGRPAVFSVSFLILSLADPAAAWAGMTFKRQPFLRKSRAGFLAHLVVTAVLLLGFLFGVSHLHWAVALAGAVTLAAVLSGVEGLSTKGFDNLTVPLAASAGLNALLWLAQ